MGIFKDRHDDVGGELGFRVGLFDFSLGVEFVAAVAVGPHPNFSIVVFQDGEAAFVTDIFVGVGRIESDVFEYLVFERNHQNSFLIQGDPDIVLFVLEDTMDFGVSHIQVDKFRLVGREGFVVVIVSFQTVAVGSYP